VETARAAAGSKDLVVVGADVASQCLERGLVDELLVMVLPVLLGAGTPLYKPEKATRVELEALTSSSSRSVQLLRYRVREKVAGNARPADRSAPVVS
jgi:dihydrofolate reductase